MSVVAGVGLTRSRLQAYLDGCGATRVGIISAGRSFETSGASEAVLNACENRRVAHLRGVRPNPRTAEIDGAIRWLERARPEVLVAVGGGSCIDTAKALLARAAQPSAWSWGDPVATGTSTPLVAIPTTTGTGAEATHFATVYLGERKLSVSHPSLRPAYTILDPEFVRALPDHLARETALDALSHSVESLWSRGATEASRDFACAALRLVTTGLAPALEGDPPARGQLLMAAHLAGRAIEISKTTAAHALSYALTQEHRVPHGLACAALLPEVARYNGVPNAPFGNPLAEGLQVPTLSDVPERLAALFELGRQHSELSGEADPASLAARVNRQRLGNNPTRLGHEA